MPAISHLGAIALWLLILMAGAWVVQQRTGNSSRVDTIWIFRSVSSAPPARYGR
jgi:steroid 5-alpha reductase family enzyme